MPERIPVLFDPDCPPGTAFLLPPVPVAVYYPIKQIAPTVEQEIWAIVRACLVAAEKGQIGVITNQGG